MRKKVLIIGNSAKEYALAKKLAETCEVYVAPGNDGIAEFTNCIDIRPNSAQELLEFVLENSIDITIPVAAESLSSDIVK
jgi:phosphoribosylamine--glycine ligase